MRMEAWVEAGKISVDKRSRLMEAHHKLRWSGALISSEVGFNQCSIDGCQRGPSGLRHRHHQLALQNLVNPRNAGSAVGGQPPAGSAADAHRLCSQREGFQYVGTGADAAIE